MASLDTVPSARAVRACSRVVGAAVGVTVVLVVRAVLEWASGAKRLMAGDELFPPIVPNTCVALLLAAVALACLQAGRRRGVIILGSVCAVASAAIGLAALTEYATGQDLGIDHLLVRDELCFGAAHCGRSSGHAAASLVGLAGAMLASRARSARGRVLAQCLAIAVALGALIALSGHIYGAAVLYRLTRASRTGLSTEAGLSLLALALGVLAARPRDGLMAMVTSAGLGGTLARRFLLAAFAAPVVGFVVMEGQRAGLYEYETSVALLAVAALVAGVALTLVTARSTDKADRALRASEERYRALIEQASDGILIADLEGRYTDVNTAGSRMFGYERDELLGKTILDLVREEDLPRFAEHKASLFGGNVELGEWRIRRKDGTTIPVEVSAKLLPDGRWQAIVRDITERKQLEHELERRESNLNRAQAVAQIGSWTLDVRQNVLVWSDENHRIFGIPKGGQMTYETFLSRVHPDDREYVDRRWKAACRGEPYDIEHRIVVDGKVSWVRERAALELRRDGTLLGGVGTTQDITERKAAQTALERAHGAEREMRARLERLSAATVAVSGAVATMADTGIDDVFRTIAHEARSVTRATCAAIGLACDPTSPFYEWIEDGMPEGSEVLTGRMPQPLLGAVARSRTLRIADVRADLVFGGPSRQDPPIAAFLGTPIRFRGKVLGNLYLAKPPGAGEFTPEDEIVVEMLAVHAGTELRTAQLFEHEAHERARLETILEGMPAGVIVADAGGSTVRNEAMRALSSPTGEIDPFGQSVTVDLRTSDGERLPIDQHPLVRALRRGEETRSRELIARVGGVDMPVLVSGAPIRDARSREIVGAVATFQDITALKQLERMREEWISIIGHDLRQPLNAIGLGVQLLARQLAREPLDLATATSSVDKITAASKRLERMIEDLTDVSRIEARRLALEQHDADLGPLVREWWPARTRRIGSE